MNDNVDSEPILDLVNEYLERTQRGEAPTIEEYCDRHPQLAEEIRELFPALELMEDLQPASDETAAHSDRGGPLPDRIGDYDIIAEIGRGGMGVVYEAEQQSLGRRVALKVLPQSSRLGDSAQIRFQREARAAAQMHHTNIVPVFEVGEEEGIFFYAMQLIQGQSLDHVIDELSSPGASDRSPTGLRGPDNVELAERSESVTTRPTVLSGSTDGSSGGSGRRRFYRAVARIALQAAEAVAYAHARGVIHRDIKPSNLILDADGVLWVTDFGLAKTDEEGVTLTGDFLGTLRYMSPERFEGQCDARADIYALGLTLYEMLALRPAFQSSDRLQLIDLICKSDPPKLRSLDRRIPKDLETIVLKAVEKEPKSRYASAKELSRDLQRFLDDVPIHARRASLSERFVRWSRRNKSLAASLLGIIALVSLLAIVSTLAWFRQSQLLELSNQRGRQLQRNLYFAEMNLAGQAASDSYGAPTIRGRLQQWHPKAVGQELRGWEWYYLYALSHREKYESPRLRGWVWTVDYSPSGSEFVNGVNGWGIQVRNAQTGEVVRDKFLGSARCVDWSHDGRRIAVTGFGGNITVCDAATLDTVWESERGEYQEVYWVSWSPDDTKLATCRNPAEGESCIARIWDAANGDLLQTLGVGEQHGREAQWSPDGDLLATAADSSTKIWDVTTWESLHHFEEHSWTVCWSPDGKWLASGHDPITMRNATTGETLATLDPASPIFDVRWRPGADHVACGHVNGTITLWDAQRGERLRKFLGHTSHVRGLAWNPDGTQIVTGGLHNFLRIWDVDTSEQTQRIPQVTGGDWAGDGDHLACIGKQGVLLWNSANGVWRDINPSEKGLTIDSVCASVQGSRVAFAGRSFVKVWDAQMGVVNLPGVPGWMNDVTCNHDGSRVAALTWGGEEVMVWDANNAKLLHVLDGIRTSTIAWNHDGSQMATGGVGGNIRIWNPTGALVWEANRDTPQITAARYSPDGSKLATAEDGAIVLWDAVTGEQLAILDALREAFSSVDWSPDESRLVTSSGTAVNIWDVTTGLVAMQLHAGGAWSVRWNPDGRRIAASSHEGAIYVWDATRGYELSAAD